MKDKHLQIRISDQFKAMMKLRSDYLGMEISAYVRTLVCADLIHCGILDVFVASDIPELFLMNPKGPERQ